jgi:hypothetical protein
MHPTLRSTAAFRQAFRYPRLDALDERDRCVAAPA